eukprot:CAMPEP_0177613184 /NCGR_PEP_ID=MMETSP0419_2-20121207/21787_1 /TAXON_ID=582737 /ORGANISM="Tetraselmis sp., Strain GSL018" /LENGTH=209 /DNA_ID=CAMNT_0019109759 /DNA_START=331 /DNA_END=957 /DNA_ORIENTATION=+
MDSSFYPETLDKPYFTRIFGSRENIFLDKASIWTPLALVVLPVSAYWDIWPILRLESLSEFCSGLAGYLSSAPCKLSLAVTAVASAASLLWFARRPSKPPLKKLRRKAVGVYSIARQVIRRGMQRGRGQPAGGHIVFHNGGCCSSGKAADSLPRFRRRLPALSFQLVPGPRLIVELITRGRPGATPPEKPRTGGRAAAAAPSGGARQWP